MRRTTTGLGLFGVLGIGLVACTPVPRPPVAVPQPVPLTPSAPITRAPTAPLTASSNWSFDRSVCSAKANGPGLSLEVAVSRAELSIGIQTAHVLSLGANSDVQITFVGRSGNWTIAGRRTAPKRITALSQMDERAVSRVLVLLSGGTVRLNHAPSGLLTLRVPNAGSAGQAWFECVKQNLFH